VGMPNSPSRVMNALICVYNHVSGGIFSVLHDGGDEMSVAVDQPSWWYDLILAQRSRMAGWKRR
jgi:hypothetical protein